MAAAPQRAPLLPVPTLSEVKAASVFDLARLPYETLAALKVDAAVTAALIDAAIALAARSFGAGDTSDRGTPERMLTVDQAAELLHCRRRWIYDHPNLPFIKRVSRKKILCSEPQLRKWLAAKR